MVSTIWGLRQGLVETNWFAIGLIGLLGVLPAIIILKLLFMLVIAYSAYAVIAITPNNYLDDDALIIGLFVLNCLGYIILSNNFGLLNWPFVRV